MIHVVVCDDDIYFLEYFKKLLETEIRIRGEKPSIVCCERGADLLEQCRKTHVDAVFLDIEMPEEDGFSIAKKLSESEEKPILVFTTNIDSLVFESFQHEPIWYLLKKNMDQLPKVVDKIIEKISETTSFFHAAIGTQIYRFPIPSILYFESRNHNTLLHTQTQEFKFRKKLNEIEKELCPQSFIRCHASYLVNNIHIKMIGRTSLTLFNGIQIPISRNKLESTQMEFMNYKGRFRL